MPQVRFNNFNDGNMTILTKDQSRELIRRLKNMKLHETKSTLAKEFNISRETLYKYWRMYKDKADDKGRYQDKLDTINNLIKQVKAIDNYFADHPDSPDQERQREKLISKLLEKTLD